MPEPVLVGLDIGTFETKGVATSITGDVLVRTSVPHRVSHPRPGWAEHDADEVWWADVRTVLEVLLGSLPTNHRVAGVAVSGLGPCVLPVSADLVPLRPAILYGIDTRAGEEIEELNERLGANEVRSRSGNVLTSQSAGPKITWISRHEPEVAAETAAYLTSQSYIVARLTGARVVDHLTASYTHPFYRLTSQSWDLDRFGDIVRPDQLPHLGWAGDQAGVVTAAAAAETGLPEGVPVAVGTSDAPAEALAAGVRRPGQVMAMYGSSGFFIAPTMRPRPHRSLYTAPGLAPGTWLQAAGTSSAGSVTRWALSLEGREGSPEAFASLAALAGESPPGARGLLFLPHLLGERTPVDDPGSRGAMVGLGIEHGRQDLSRALLEGVAHSMSWAIQTLAAENPLSTVTAIGGGTQNPVWTQAVSDICRLPQAVVDSPGACVGSAYLAGCAAGLTGWAHEWTPAVTHTVEPRSAYAELYARDHDRFRALYRMLAASRGSAPVPDLSSGTQRTIR